MKKLLAASDDFSVENYETWMVGRTDDLKKARQHHASRSLHYVESRSELVALALVSMLVQRGMQEDADIHRGRIVYIYKAQGAAGSPDNAAPS